MLRPPLQSQMVPGPVLKWGHPGRWGQMRGALELSLSCSFCPVLEQKWDWSAVLPASGSSSENVLGPEGRRRLNCRAHWGSVRGPGVARFPAGSSATEPGSDGVAVPTQCVGCCLIKRAFRTVTDSQESGGGRSHGLTLSFSE